MRSGGFDPPASRRSVTVAKMKPPPARSTPLRTSSIVLGLLLACAAYAAAKDSAPKGAEIEWLKSLDDARKAAAKAGKPILLVTIWGPGT